MSATMQKMPALHALSVEHFHKVKQTQHTHEGRKRKDVYFEFLLFVTALGMQSKLIDCELHLMSDDGSIRENRGKWYASFNGNLKAKQQATAVRKDFAYKNMLMPCPTCAGGRIAEQAAKLLHPLLVKRGYKIAAWKQPGSWWLFDMWSKPLTDYTATGRQQRRGPELVIVEYKQDLDCPIHGRVTRYEQEPVD